MVSPVVYKDVLNYIDENNLPTFLSFTTNLWDFYWHPDKWTSLLKRKNVGVITSFQYGEERCISPGSPYTENLFWLVSNLFLEKIGYRPDFISVVSEKNMHLSFKHVTLAKKMNVECKLNYANSSGLKDIPFPIGVIAHVYAEIFEKGLEEFEYNTKQFIKVIKNEPTTCPLLRDCDSHIRCLQPSGYYSCGAFGDDDLYDVNPNEDASNVEVPLQGDHSIFSLKDECHTCHAFKLCNGCKKHIYDLKYYCKMNNSTIIERSCNDMKLAYKRFEKVLNDRSN